MTDGDINVRVWRYPHDPWLPMLPQVCYPDIVGRTLHDLEIDRPVTLRGAQHRPAPGTVGDDVDRDRQRRVRTDVHAQVVEGAADDVRVADQRQHRQPRVVGVAPHPHVDVTVGHHQGLLGDVEVLLTLADVGAGPEQLLPRRGLRTVQLGPGDLRAVQGLDRKSVV